MKDSLKNLNVFFLKRVSPWFLAVWLGACGSAPFQGHQVPSLTKTVDIDHTPVKWQSIGNCWAYAHLAWAESLIKKSTGETLNFSESYLTYRHFEDQLLYNHWIKEVNTAGGFAGSTELIKKYGLIQEGDFIPEESMAAKSEIQHNAVGVLNESLRAGPLQINRSPAVVRAELNRAFGITDTAFAARVLLVRMPDAFKLKSHADSPPDSPLPPSFPLETLADHMDQWSEWVWHGTLNFNPENLPASSTSFSPTQTSLTKRVKRALNAGFPVIINWLVDFNALGEDGIFSMETLKANGTGRQGYHSTVMEDYVVEGVDPKTGSPFAIGEGEVADSLKELAAQEGRIQYVVLKNSWGGAERLDRPSYSRFGEKGYARLDASYLFARVPTLADDGGSIAGSDTVITSFVLPPGF